MASRRRDSLYAGALGRIAADRIATLGPDYVLQPKRDGIYALVTTDRTGSIAHILMRSGRPVPLSIAQDFKGVRIAPDSVLIAELDAFTEAADRLVASRGYRTAPVFDALRVSGRDVSRLPQHSRRDAIARAYEQLGEDQPWRDDDKRTARRADGPFCRRVPMGHRRMPLVPELPASSYSLAMSSWVDSGEAEGLVVVARRAPIGRAGAKRKHKAHLTIDAVVVDRDRYAARVLWQGRSFTVPCQGEKNAAIRVGDVVEIKADGFTEADSLPKFGRIARRRPDFTF